MEEELQKVGTKSKTGTAIILLLSRRGMRGLLFIIDGLMMMPDLPETPCRFLVDTAANGR